MKFRLSFLFSVFCATLSFAQGNRTFSPGDTTDRGQLVTKTYARKLVGDPSAIDEVVLNNVTSFDYVLTTARIKKLGSANFRSVTFTVFVGGKPITPFSEIHYGKSGGADTLHLEFGNAPIVGFLDVYPGVGHAATDLSAYSTTAVANQLYQPKGSYAVSSDLLPYLKTADAQVIYQPKGNYLTSYTETTTADQLWDRSNNTTSHYIIAASFHATSDLPLLESFSTGGAFESSVSPQGFANGARAAYLYTNQGNFQVGTFFKSPTDFRFGNRMYNAHIYSDLDFIFDIKPTDSTLVKRGRLGSISGRNFIKTDSTVFDVPIKSLLGKRSDNKGDSTVYEFTAASGKEFFGLGDLATGYATTRALSVGSLIATGNVSGNKLFLTANNINGAGTGLTEIAGFSGTREIQRYSPQAVSTLLTPFITTIARGSISSAGSFSGNPSGSYNQTSGVITFNDMPTAAQVAVRLSKQVTVNSTTNTVSFFHNQTGINNSAIVLYSVRSDAGKNPSWVEVTDQLVTFHYDYTVASGSIITYNVQISQP